MMKGDDGQVEIDSDDSSENSEDITINKDNPLYEAIVEAAAADAQQDDDQDLLDSDYECNLNLEEEDEFSHVKTFSKAMVMQESNANQYYEVQQNVENYINSFFDPVVKDPETGTFIDIKYGATTMRVCYE